MVGPPWWGAPPLEQRSLKGKKSTRRVTAPTERDHVPQVAATGRRSALLALAPAVCVAVRLCRALGVLAAGARAKVRAQAHRFGTEAVLAGLGRVAARR